MPEDKASKVAENPIKLEIKHARIEDLPIIWGIIDDCAKWLSGQNLNHWSKYYKKEMVSKMLTKKDVYMELNNGEVVGTVTLDTKPPKYYEEPGYGELFTNPNDPAVYMTALAVLPGHQGRGFAGHLLQFVEERAKERKMKWLRLDCRAEVPDLVTFYEKRGFKKLGNKPTDEGEDGTYWFMEKELL
jgi:ribosomal protein S18 acetylase RimI-like enzyme